MMNAEERIHEFQRFGSVLGLERINELLRRLGDPHKDLKVIHVAGTNGKGSVCKFLEGGLASCGYRVGLYTSPFVESFNERIRLGGENITDEQLETYTSRVMDAADEMIGGGAEPPTEFEIITAIAFLFFHEQGADIVILEVGLGGSGDSTNVVPSPMICAICSVSYDHMDRLGGTLEEIAENKAGIIKPGVPVVSNVKDHRAAAVIARKAYDQGCRLYDVSKIKFAIFEDSLYSQKISMEIFYTDYSDVEISMVGEHQGENLKTALSIIEVLRKSGDVKVERSRLYEGIKGAVQPGRFEIIREADPQEGTPIVILDGAHNAAGAKSLADTMKRYFADERVLLLTGMLADKDTTAILENFTEITDKIIVTEPDNDRKMPADELAAKLEGMGIEPAAVVDRADSVEFIKDIWKDYDAVLCAGSLYLIGEIRRRFKDG